jgi:hypothetical protein
LLKFFIQKEYIYGGQISKILLLALQAKSIPGSLLNKALAVVDALEGKVRFFFFVRNTLFSFLESIIIQTNVWQYLDHYFILDS